MGSILGDACNEVGTAIFVSFRCDALKLFVADAGAKKLFVDSSIMNGYETIGLEKV
jgi:hypothetical protein